MAKDEEISLAAPPQIAAEDERLVQECLSGDEQAWNRLIDKYKRLIYSIPVKYALSPEDAADVFQAVCVDLFTNLQKLRKVESLAEARRKMVLDQIALPAAKLAEFGTGGGKLGEKNRHEILELRPRKPASRCRPARFFSPKPDNFVVLVANDSGYVGRPGPSTLHSGFS